MCIHSTKFHSEARKLLKAPEFTFTTYLTRGQSEREIEVEATYSFDGDEVRLLTAYDRTCGGELHNLYEIDSVYDAACERAGSDYAEWQADYEQFIADVRAERLAA